MTPNGIEVLIHCHVCPAPHPRRDTPAVVEELRNLQANGLIEPDRLVADCYKTTERGRAHIAQLCRMAWPVKAWMSENGQLIELDV